MTIPSPLANRAERWSSPVRVLHWATVPLLGIQFAASFLVMGDGTSALSRLGFHVLLGTLVVVTFGARLVCRLFDHGPAGRRVVVRILQAIIYLVALGVSATGWLAYRPSPFAPRAVLFGFFELPVLSSLVRLAPWAFWHKWLVWLLLLLVTGHIIMAFWHAFRPGDRVMVGMSLTNPRRPSSQRSLARGATRDYP